MLKAVVGMQFGDEGKGKLVDYLAGNIKHIARFNGGANAGHTVQVNGIRTHFSQLPATLENKNLYVAQGALISPKVLLNELQYIHDIGINSTIHIDPRCHVVLPIHVALNRASEFFKGSKKIGSVGNGIGACFEDKSNRHGVRLFELTQKEVLKDKLSLLWDIREKQIHNVFSCDHNINIDEIVETYHGYGKQLEKYFTFTNEVISDLLANDEDILLETSQATFLDNSFGTYPYTVAYQTLIQTCFGNIGIPAQEIDILGVFKAYMIRVGNGPFPTELSGSLADSIREQGNEYGTVSGRSRRCGWLDLNLVKHSAKLNGINRMCITNVDVLANMEEIDVAIGYEQNGKTLGANEALLSLDNVKPIYRTFESWPKLTGSYNLYNDFPEALRDYINFIEDYIGVPIEIISYGPDRSQTLCREEEKDILHALTYTNQTAAYRQTSA